MDYSSGLAQGGSIRLAQSLYYGAKGYRRGALEVILDKELQVMESVSSRVADTVQLSDSAS